MFIIGHLLRTLAGILHFLLQIGILLFIVRAVMSWFQPDPRNSVVAFIYSITDPVLNRLRGIIPPLGAVDLSPVVAVLLCWFLDGFLVPSLKDLGYHLLK